jgi:hypothetical protein
VHQDLEGERSVHRLRPDEHAIEKFPGMLTEEVIKHHIVPRDLYTDELKGGIRDAQRTQAHLSERISEDRWTAP